MKTWTKKQLKLLRELYPTIKNVSDICPLVGNKTYSAVRSKAKVLKLTRDRAISQTGRSKATPEVDAYLQENYLKVPLKRMTITINERFNLNRSDTFTGSRMKQLGLVVPREIIEKFKRESRYQPGDIPVNKGKKQTEFMSPEAIEKTKATRFHSGQKIWNEGQDGEIRIRHDHPDRNGGRKIKYIRLAKGNWQELQRYNWEKLHGPIPPKMVLRCISGDTLNCDPSNWVLITMADNARLNKNYNITDQLAAAKLVPGISKNKKLRNAVMELYPEQVKAKRQLMELNRLILKKKKDGKRKNPRNTA